MSDRFYLFLAQGERSTASYFSATEMAADPGSDWVEEQLLPAVRTLAARRSKAIRQWPITFWLLARPTARLERGEVFVFVTPWSVPRQISQAIRTVLERIPGAKINEGIEPIPEEAVPCCQAFKGKVLRFFGDFVHTGDHVHAGIRWIAEEGGPRVVARPFELSLAENEADADALWVRARVQEETSEGAFRAWQLCLARAVAMRDGEDQAKPRGPEKGED
jgi:hypothetical protein